MPNRNCRSPATELIAILSPSDVVHSNKACGGIVFYRTRLFIPRYGQCPAIGPVNLNKEDWAGRKVRCRRGASCRILEYEDVARLGGIEFPSIDDRNVRCEAGGRAAASNEGYGAIMAVLGPFRRKHIATAGRRARGANDQKADQPFGTFVGVLTCARPARVIGHKGGRRERRRIEFFPSSAQLPSSRRHASYKPRHLSSLISMPAVEKGDDDSSPTRTMIPTAAITSFSRPQCASCHLGPECGGYHSQGQDQQSNDQEHQSQPNSQSAFVGWPM
jgi:hypothetical protein